MDHQLDNQDPTSYQRIEDINPAIRKSCLARTPPPGRNRKDSYNSLDEQKKKFETRNNDLHTHLPNFQIEKPGKNLTDEDEVKSDSEWVSVHHKKRQRNDDSPELKNSKQATLKDYWLSKTVLTSNRYEALENNTTSEEAEMLEDQKDEQPPPIFIQNVECIKPLQELLQQITPGKYTLKCLANNQIKVQADSSKNYSLIVKSLAEKNTQYHTYQLKQNRGFRVVIRNLHPSTDPDDIKKALLVHGHTALNISNIKQRGTKKDLPLCNIELAIQSTNHRVTAPISHSICQSSPLIHNRDSGGVVGNESNSNQAKKSLYENHGVAACSHNRALCIATIVFAFLFTLAVIIAFTGPQTDCPCAGDIKSSYVDEKANMTRIFEPRATNGQIFPWNNIRLPTSLRPHRYNLTIHPNLTTLEVRSQVSIEFQAEKETNFIVLHCKNLTILDKIIQDRHGNNLTIIKMLEYLGGQQLYIEIREKFKKRHNYVLRIRYNSKLNREYLATTHFEPTFARTAFPCFDEPQFKAKFRLTVFRDRFHISLFNTPVVKTDVLGFYMGTGLLYDEFLETNEISTYLVAFVICDFSQRNKQTESGVSVSIYTPEPFVSRAPFTLETTSFFLDYYENFFGVAFPLPKLDIVALPEFDYGAMENWGLITYRETAIFSNTNDNDTFIAAHQWLISKIAHELAHQY
ncbi:unnamed protein product [Diabrotica balteata]|uniref:Uncharacterized protein n=1 Tax=Diabrotica balteata TaxID=107213 RepID=A0A9N9SPZ6_DIABA|nr:unnamed protein product [Diabrotica balteata]